MFVARNPKGDIDKMTKIAEVVLQNYDQAPSYDTTHNSARIDPGFLNYITNEALPNYVELLLVRMYVSIPC